MTPTCARACAVLPAVGDCATTDPSGSPDGTYCTEASRFASESACEAWARSVPVRSGTLAVVGCGAVVVVCVVVVRVVVVAAVVEVVVVVVVAVAVVVVVAAVVPGARATLRVTTVPFFALVPAAGTCATTVPARDGSETVTFVARGSSPAFVICAPASPTARVVTSGTTTAGAPWSTTIVTFVPRFARWPAFGSWATTTPVGFAVGR